MPVAVELPQALRPVPLACLPAYRVAAQSADRDVRRVVRVPVVDLVQEQPLVLLELHLARALRPAASRKDAHRAVLEAGPEPAQVSCSVLVSVQRLEEALPAVRSVLTQVRVAASHRAHPVQRAQHSGSAGVEAAALLSPLEPGRELDEEPRLVERLVMGLPSAPGQAAAERPLGIPLEPQAQVLLWEQREVAWALDEELPAEAQRVEAKAVLAARRAGQRVAAVLSGARVVPAALSEQQQVAVVRRAVAAREERPWEALWVQPSDPRELVLPLAQRRKMTPSRHEPRDLESARLRLQSSSAGSFESFSCCPVCEKK